MNIFHRLSYGLAVLILAVPVLTGCRHTYEEIRIGSTTPAGPKLASRSSVYVALPADARYKDELVINSGSATAIMLRNAFAEQVRRAYIGRQPETRDEALAIARRGRITYLVYPTIIRWEDRATEYTGLRDRVEVQIDVLDALSAETLHSVILKGNSRWMTDGGDKPEDVLREPVEKFVASLFQPVHVPSALRR